jgi:hypothetical protein
MRSDRYKQQDLFAMRPMCLQLDVKLQGALRKLVEKLLVEAAGVGRGDNATGSIVEGAADDEDHQ